MAKDRKGASNALAKDIKRQIGTGLNKAFLQRMPLFKVDAELPRRLTGLLAELEATEKYQRRRGGHT